MLSLTIISCTFNWLGLDVFPCDSLLDSSLSAFTHPHNVTSGVGPLPCHSHNDEWRTYPLYTALSAGCTSIEVDVWLFDGVENIYVGHDARDLTVNRTLSGMYIQPLVEMLDNINARQSQRILDDILADRDGHQQSNNATLQGNQQNENPAYQSKHGVFLASPNTALILLLDYKSAGPPLHAAIHAHLTPLREKNYLTYYSTTTGTLIPGPITVVATGNAPFDLIQGATASDSGKRDIFFDAPLRQLPSENEANKYNISTTFMASSSFPSAVGRLFWPFHRLSKTQLEKIRSQVRAARDKGLVSRYWGTPGWPRGVRDYVWKVLVEEGIGVLCGDDVWGLAEVVGREEQKTAGEV